MKKIKLLLAAMAAMVGVGANAINIETDLTSSFNSLATTNWTGSSGQVGWAAPQVTTNSGLTVAAWERYNGSCDWTGDIMYTTVTGLATGTYKIELYGAAAFTFARGFGSEAFTGDLSKDTSDTYTENQSIDTNTGVTLYATTSEGTVEQEIPIWYATNFNTSGIATVVLDGVKVGSNGEIKIGLSKTSKSTNWHVVQLKGVTATVDADAALAVAVNAAEAVDQEANMEASVLAALRSALNESKTVDKTDANAILEVINALNTARNDANASISAYSTASGYFTKMKAVLDNTNVYTEEAYNAYYGTWLAGYNDKTLETAIAATLTEATAFSTGWHAANNIDDILLSSWTIGGEQAKNYDKALYINTWSTEGNSDGSEFYTPFFEYWTSDEKSLGATTMTSTITDLKPNATYSFTIRARVRQTNGKTKIANGIMMQVGEGTAVDISSGAQFNSGVFYIGNFSALGMTDADGKLTVNITVADNSNISWLSFYNCKYTEGEDLSAYIADYEFALANVNTALADAAYAAWQDDMQEAATTYATVDNTDKAALIAAKEALENALNEYNAIVAPLKGTDLSAWTTTGNNGQFHVNTWSGEGTTDGSNMVTPFVENWIGKGTSLTNATMSYTVEGLTPGYYKVTALIRSLNEAGGANPAGSFIFANDAIERAYGDNATACTNGVYGNPVVYGFVGEDGKLTIGVKIIEANVNWVSWKNFVYEFVGTELTAEIAANLTEEARTFTHNATAIAVQKEATDALTSGLSDANYIEAGKAIETAYNTPDYQTIALSVSAAKWATFIAPFEVTIPEGVKAYTVEGLETDGTTLTLSEVETKIAANTPVVLNAESAISTNVQGINAATDNLTHGLLTGVYTETQITSGYVLQYQAENGIGFYAVSDSNPKTVPAYHAYLTVPDQENGVKFFGFGDTATRINGVLNALQAGETYDLSGRRVSKFQKGGVYIVNGVKVAVK